MTLGGLALAVGILVDDATVTIENMNYHLEMGKEVERPSWMARRQIVVPATVSLLCICIVFVPMFALGGVAGYLFRPLAEAVVFAMIGSYILSRTLVPTLANFLLQKHKAHHGPRKRGGSSSASSVDSSGVSQQSAARMALCSTWPWPSRTHACRLRDLIVLSFGLYPMLGQNFFPPVDSDQIKLHVRAQTGTRIEEVSALCGRIERRSVPHHSARPSGNDRRQYRHAGERHQPCLRQFRH